MACEKFVPRPLSTDSISSATSFGILTDVAAVFPPASKPASTGSARAADNRTPEQNRIIELKQGNRRLRMEADVLKQAALIFARK